MPRYKIQNEDGRTITVEGATPPTDDDVAAIFETQKRRDALVAPAVAGARGRNTDAANAELARVDPRMAAAGTVEVSPRTMASGAAMTAGLLAPFSGPLVRGAIGALPGAIRGNPKEAAIGAITDAAGGPILGKVLQWARPAAAPAAELSEAALAAGRERMGSVIKRLGMTPHWEMAPKTVSSMMAPAAAEAAPQTVAAMASEAAPATGAFTKTIEPLTMESVMARIAKFKEAGFSPGQIIASLKETHGLKESVAKKVLDMVEGLAQ